MPRLSAVGILFLQEGEDVKTALRPRPGLPLLPASPIRRWRGVGNPLLQIAKILLRLVGQFCHAKGVGLIHQERCSPRQATAMRNCLQRAQQFFQRKPVHPLR